MIAEVGYQAVNQPVQSTSQNQNSTKGAGKGVHNAAIALCYG
ncbi:MAG: hypothetical protein U1E64_07880 [Sphingomonadaceae bacterium]|jgi:hypothetical protein